MFGRILIGVLIAAVLVAGAAGVGVAAYRAGIAQGLLQSDKIVVQAPPEGGAAPYPYYYPAPFFFHRPFGFGFGFLGCLFPLLALFVVFGLMRFIFRPWGWRHGGWGGPGMMMHGPWGLGHGEGWKHAPEEWRKRAQTMFDELHREAHQPKETRAEESPSQ